MAFQCAGPYRVGKSLPTPSLNASSLLQASEIVQQAMAEANIWVDQVNEINSGSGEASSSALYVLGHGVSTFWGFVDSVGVLVLCRSSIRGGSGDSVFHPTWHSDYEVWIISRSKMGSGDFGVNGKRIEMFARALQGKGSRERSGTQNQCRVSDEAGSNHPHLTSSAMSPTRSHPHRIGGKKRSRQLLSVGGTTAGALSQPLRPATAPKKADTPGTVGTPVTPVVVGAQVLVDTQYKSLAQYTKVGIIADPTTILPATMTHLIDQMVLVDQIRSSNNVVVFAPEHGFRGAAQAGQGGASYIDAKTGVQVYNTYGKCYTALNCVAIVYQCVQVVVLTCEFVFCDNY